MSSFITRNKPDWDELEHLVAKARRSVAQLSPQEMSRLDVLYRRTTIHLARVATRTTDQQLILYLNGLTAAAHSLIYLPPKRSMFAGAALFVAEGFARTIARNWRHHALSAALFFAGAVLAYYLSVTDTLAAYALSMPGDPRQPGATREQLEEILRHGRDQGSGEKFFFASFLFQHNLKVGVLSMAAGVLAGVPTMLLMIYNGMILGAFVAIHAEAGLTREMWAWILPHGVTEIGAIILCGGVGLILGQAVVRPGQLSRGESLRQAGFEAARTCAGVAVMLVVAAFMESFLRQSHLSTDARLAFAGGSAVFWGLYIAYGVFREHADKRRILGEHPPALESPEDTA